MKEENARFDEIEPRELIEAIMRKKLTMADIPTYVLCDELEHRQSVSAVWIGPYEVSDCQVEGPARVFVVRD